MCFPRHVLAWLGAGLLSGGVQAAGFALIEQNASGLGNAYAGQAALAEDASAVYFNPAGLVRWKDRQVAAALHYIRPSARFDGAASPALSAAEGGEAGEPVWVPNLYLSSPLSTDLWLGLGLNAPFGMSSRYDTPWAGMTQAVASELRTLNVNPSLAWRVNDQFSLGLGLNWQRAEASLTSVVAPATLAKARLSGSDASWGWNAGMLWQPDADHRLGLSYRSAIRHRLEGHMRSPMGSAAAWADLDLPDSASLGLWKRLNPRWELMADLSWTGWSRFEHLTARLKANDAVVSHVDEHWEDTWRVGLGLSHHRDARWTWRAGLAWDQGPVPDAAHRTARIPDADRYWLALGGQYRLSPRQRLDFGYAHLFVERAAIDHLDAGVRLKGHYDNTVDVVSLQYTQDF